MPLFDRVCQESEARGRTEEMTNLASVRLHVISLIAHNKAGSRGCGRVTVLRLAGGAVAESVSMQVCVALAAHHHTEEMTSPV